VDADVHGGVGMVGIINRDINGLIHEVLPPGPEEYYVRIIT
jgi:hypothetical protein